MLYQPLLFWVMPERGSLQTVEPFLILSCPLIISASGRPGVPAGFLLARLGRKRPRTEADGSPVYAPASATLSSVARWQNRAGLARIAHLRTQSRGSCAGPTLLNYAAMLLCSTMLLFCYATMLNYATMLLCLYYAKPWLVMPPSIC